VGLRLDRETGEWWECQAHMGQNSTGGPTFMQSARERAQYQQGAPPAGNYSYSKALPQASFGNPIDHFRVDQATGEVTCCAAVKAANQPRYGRTRPCDAITNVIP
jgi:hypothetical protein